MSRALPQLSSQERVERLRRSLLDLCWRSLDRGLNAMTRHLLEVLLCSLCLAFPAVVEEELLPAFARHSARPTVLASLVVVAGYAALDCVHAIWQAQLLRLVLPCLLPLLSSNFGHTRLVTQSARTKQQLCSPSRTPDHPRGSALTAVGPSPLLCSAVSDTSSWS